MITIFTVPKPFVNKTNILQRNAIQSWTHLEPRPEVLLFGDELGIKGIAVELGLSHCPELKTNEFGTPMVNWVFTKAQELAQNDIVVCSNADIIIPSAFSTTVLELAEEFHQLLVVGQRWDCEIDGLIDFDNPNWEAQVFLEVSQRGRLHQHWGIDVFAFRCGLYYDIPAFAWGRTSWDNWLVRFALDENVPVFDMTEVVMIVHQDHGKNYFPTGNKRTEILRNQALLAETGRPLAGVAHATYRLQRR